MCLICKRLSAAFRGNPLFQDKRPVLFGVSPTKVRYQSSQGQKAPKCSSSSSDKWKGMRGSPRTAPAISLHLGPESAIARNYPQPAHNQITGGKRVETNHDQSSFTLSAYASRDHPCSRGFFLKKKPHRRGARNRLIYCETALKVRKSDVKTPQNKP